MLTITQTDRLRHLWNLVDRYSLSRARERKAGIADPLSDPLSDPLMELENYAKAERKSRSKTGRKECSDAARAWKTTGMTPEHAKTLAWCRSLGKSAREARMHRAAGNELKAQALEHRVKTGKVGQKARGDEAETLKGERLATTGDRFGRVMDRQSADRAEHDKLMQHPMGTLKPKYANERHEKIDKLGKRVSAGNAARKESERATVAARRKADAKQDSIRPEPIPNGGKFASAEEARKALPTGTRLSIDHSEGLQGHYEVSGHVHRTMDGPKGWDYHTAQLKHVGGYRDRGIRHAADMAKLAEGGEGEGRAKVSFGEKGQEGALMARRGTDAGNDRVESIKGEPRAAEAPKTEPIPQEGKFESYWESQRKFPVGARLAVHHGSGLVGHYEVAGHTHHTIGGTSGGGRKAKSFYTPSLWHVGGHREPGIVSLNDVASRGNATLGLMGQGKATEASQGENGEGKPVEGKPAEKPPEWPVERPKLTPRVDPKHTVSKARYAKGMMAVHAPSDDSYKTRAARLAEHVGGRYSGREDAYIMSPAKAARMAQLHEEGWDASTVTGKLRPHPDGRTEPPKAVRAKVEKPESKPALSAPRADLSVKPKAQPAAHSGGGGSPGPFATAPAKGDAGREAVEQGYRDWHSGRAYLDNAGNYRLRAEGEKSGSSRHIAPWNKAVKQAHPDSLDFHKAATAHAASPSTGRPNPPESPSRPARQSPGESMPLDQFATHVHRAAILSKPEHRFGGATGDKVFIHHVHSAFEKEHGPMPVDKFKDRLAEANRARHLNLSRADLVEAMDPEDVKKSVTSVAGGPHKEEVGKSGYFHFVRTDKPSQPGQPKESPAKPSEGPAKPAPGGKVYYTSMGNIHPHQDLKAAEEAHSHAEQAHNALRSDFSRAHHEAVRHARENNLTFDSAEAFDAHRAKFLRTPPAERDRITNEFHQTKEHVRAIRKRRGLDDPDYDARTGGYWTGD